MRLAVCTLLLLSSAPVLAEAPRVNLVVGEKAPLERLAAEHIGAVLKRLYGAEINFGSVAEGGAAHVILIGSPDTNPQIEPFAKQWPKLSDQGHALKSVDLAGGNALLIGGGSPAATFWAASEFAHRLGVRSLLYSDLDPIKPPEFSLAGYDSVYEPLVKRRACQTLDRFPSGTESWGLADQKRLLHQLSKLKYNHVVLSVQPWQPLVDFEVDNVKKETGVLWYGWQFPVSGDTAGRAAFSGAKLFENPDFAGQTTYEKRLKAGQTLVRGIIAEAHTLGMTVSLSLNPREFPREFAKVLPGSRPVPGSYELAIEPAGAEKGGDEILARLTEAQLAAYRRTYPEIDAIDSAKLKPAIASVLPQTIEALTDGPGSTSISSHHVGDLDLAAYWLSRQCFDDQVTRDSACETLLTPICGEDVASRVLKAIGLVEQATQLANQHDAALAMPAPDMILKHYASDEPAPAWWGQARDCYLNAMNEMYRANTRAREGGRSYTLYLARRYEFGMEYMNCVTAVRNAGIAKRKGDTETQLAELEKAIESIYGGLNALAAVSRSQSDRGTIALLNEFGYRALQKELAAADEAAK